MVGTVVANKEGVMKRIIALTIMAAAMVVGNPQGELQAAEEKKPVAKKSTAKKKRDTFPFRGKVGKVDEGKGTFTIVGKSSTRIFTVSAKTKVIKGGKSASLKDAKSGEDVGGMCKRTGENSYEAVSVRFGPKTKK